MSGRARIAGFAGFAAMAAGLGFASIAWACTAQVGIAPLAQLAGEPGNRVGVTGTADRSGPVEIRWNGVKGPLLGTAVADRGDHGTSFATEVTIPEAPAGVHYLVLVPRDAAVGVGRAAFEVVPSASSDGREPASSVATRASSGLWSELGNAGDAPGPVRSTPAFTAGVALLGVGMVAMIAGFGVAATRRRSRVRIARFDSDPTE